MKVFLALLALYFLFYYQHNQRKISGSKKTSIFSGDPYEVLEIDSSSTDDDVKQAFRELSKKNHPDLVSHMSKDFQKLAEEKLKKINWAYQEIRKVRGF